MVSYVMLQGMSLPLPGRGTSTMLGRAIHSELIPSAWSDAASAAQFGAALHYWLGERLFYENTTRYVFPPCTPPHKKQTERGTLSQNRGRWGW